MIRQIKDEHVLEEIMPDIVGLPQSDIICLEGELGAGKTTFVKVFCRFIGVTHIVQSPTYSIINTYPYRCNGVERIVYHLDLYRLKTTDDLLQIGFEDILDSADRLLIEWPALAIPFLDRFVQVKITVQDKGHRQIVVGRSV